MPLFEFLSFVFAGGVAAGLLGALTGLGGGVVIVPLLTLVFGVDIRYAIGASLISVIATSSGAAATYVREGFTNMRIGMFLELATTFGAIAGACVAAKLPTHIIAVIFGLVLLLSAYLTARPKVEASESKEADPIASFLRMDGNYPGRDGTLHHYHVYQVPGGFSMMFGAGIISGLLGIGSGAVKVLAMDQVMHIPFKVSTTTSNFMIGVTAAASAGIYLARGYIDPLLAMPVMLGVLLGSILGAKILMAAKVSALRMIFTVVIVCLGLEMIGNGLTGRL